MEEEAVADDKVDLPDSVVESGRAFECAPRWRNMDYPVVLPPRTPSAAALANMCRLYGIRNEQDCVHLEEYAFGDMRLDMLTVDLQTHYIRGYEVKVQRRDFLRDEKWHLYLRFVNYFYFVVPQGLIRGRELPDEVWLLEYRIEEPRRHTTTDYGRPRDEKGALPTHTQILGYPEAKLAVAKKGKRLQPRFTRETYTEHFFHRVIMDYVRKLRWRADRWGKVCKRCMGEIGAEG